MADAHFDIFVTPDRQIPSQQNLVGLRVRIVILRARSNDISDLLPLVPNLRAATLRILPRPEDETDSSAANSGTI